jgi:tRNA threonylcarbamoyladenosine biosynthesis protein TsaB
VLLALDTSTPLVSVALCAGGRVRHEATSERPMLHGELLAPMVAGALDAVGATRGDLTEVAVGVGPGPFTGLRVGVVTGLTLGLALGIPVHGVGSLDVLAARAVAEGVRERFVATVDARRKELFWAVYAADGTRLEGPHVSRPADLPADLLVVGAGPVLYPEAFDRVAGPAGPDAATLARLVAEGRATLVDPEPVYLRRPDAAVPGPPKRVS